LDQIVGGKGEEGKEGKEKKKGGGGGRDAFPHPAGVDRMWAPSPKRKKGKEGEKGGEGGGEGGKSLHPIVRRREK